MASVRSLGSAVQGLYTGIRSQPAVIHIAVQIVQPFCREGTATIDSEFTKDVCSTSSTRSILVVVCVSPSRFYRHPSFSVLVAALDPRIRVCSKEGHLMLRFPVDRNMLMNPGPK